jgi:hypothetical protein
MSQRSLELTAIELAGRKNADMTEKAIITLLYFSAVLAVL